MLTTPSQQEYADHNPPELILSESDHSYIIGNIVSYDERQYPSWLLPKFRPGKTPAGQGYGHLLVIPKERVAYNIVDPAATKDLPTPDRQSIAEGLQSHFVSFWESAGGPAAVARRARKGLQDQYEVLAAKDAAKAEIIQKEVMEGFEHLTPEFEKLRACDFTMAFHPFPWISIGHLHMHVFPASKQFRQFSSHKQDLKTIPLAAVVEVEREAVGLED